MSGDPGSQDYLLGNFLVNLGTSARKRAFTRRWDPMARCAFADRRATWWVTTSPGEPSVAAGRHDCLLFDGTADPPQVPPEGVGRFGFPPRQVFAEGCLLAQGLTRLDLTSLIPLDLADLPGCGQDLLSLAGCDEHHAVLVAEDDVVAGDQPCPESCAGQRGWFLLIEANRAGRAVAVAEYRQGDLGQFRRIAVQSPHHHPADPCRLCLQHYQIADARLIFPPAVVDDQDVTMGGAVERFQEHINAAVVAGRERASGDPLSRHDRADSRRRDPQRHSPTDTGIGHQRRRKAAELRQHPARPSSLPVTLPDATPAAWPGLRATTVTSTRIPATRSQPTVVRTGFTR